jgi:hypothetical protein
VKFFDPRGRATFGVGICDRCRRRFSIEDLYSDPNSPGLKVCIDDRDEYDPYRLAARQTENITLPFVRPDQPLTNGPETFNLLHAFLATETPDYLICENDDYLILEND